MLNKKKKIKIFKKLIEEKDFLSLVDFISKYTKDKEELLEIYNSSKITTDAMVDLINYVTDYMNNSSSILESAKRIIDSDILSYDTKKRMLEIGLDTGRTINTFCNKFYYFISLIKEETERKFNNEL